MMDQLFDCDTDLIGNITYQEAVIIRPCATFDVAPEDGSPIERSLITRRGCQDLLIFFGHFGHPRAAG